jgi:propionyl-CoA carboxylase alpha chain/3-methylcrotonyl-CoA carboxylase alpha subunit
MKKVDRAEDFADGLASARREGKASFGDDRVLIESYITRPRHIEVQVFGDSHGTVVHLHERDCSLQRRHQKVIEEAPAPGMDAATRKAVTDAAVRAAKAVNYQGAGTIEFIADASDGLKADRIWFMEMNTRLQVEHPVTESITGVDLVEWQFRVAAGEPIPLKQADIPMNGWAMEARLYAEDPANGFLPSIGKLDHFVLPDDIRVDTGVMQGGEVSQFYDPMIAKLIVHEDTREAAAEALADACAEVEVWPVRTNAGFLVRCLEHPRFVQGDVDTGFIGAEEATLVPVPPSDLPLAAALGWKIEDFVDATYENDLWGPSPEHLFGFRLNGPQRPAHLKFRQDGVPREALVHIVERAGDWNFDYSVDGASLDYRDLEAGDSLPTTHGDGVIRTFRRGDVSVFDFSPVGGNSAESPASDGSLRAPMPGKIVAAPAVAGDTVAKGAPIVVLEAMKMEHALVAPFDGVVETVGVSVGEQVGEGTVLAVVKPAGEA